MRKTIAGVLMVGPVVFAAVWTVILLVRVVTLIRSPSWGGPFDVFEAALMCGLAGVFLWGLYRLGGFRSNQPYGNLDQTSATVVVRNQ